MKGWLINIALLEDRFILILFNLFKIGIIRTHSDGFNGISIVLGIWKIEFQANISLVNDIKIRYNKHEAGNA